MCSLPSRVCVHGLLSGQQSCCSSGAAMQAMQLAMQGMWGWWSSSYHYGQPWRHQLLVKLRTLVAVIPLDTSECERGFSTMNLIMSPSRARLSDSKLDWLMRVALLGPNIKDFNPKPVIQKWLADSKRSRQLNKLEWHLNKLMQ